MLQKKRKVPLSGERGPFLFSVLFAFENLRIRRVVNMPLRRTQGEADAIPRGFVHFVSIAARTHGADRQDWTDFFYLKKKKILFCGFLVDLLM